jgi:uncharacterized membrane protein YphA (DoxX/SURF4 family)/peroxiredoxin
VAVELALLLARLLLSAVFLLAGIGKLGDPKGAIQALKDFGLPGALARPLSLLLCVGEIAIAVALVPLAGAWYGACAALGLLGIFVMAIGITLARGRRPDCHCFGQLHSAPVGWKTLVRNGILVALAGWLVIRGPGQVGPSLWGHLASAGENERKFFIIGGCVMAFLTFRALRRKEAPQESADSESDFDLGWETSEKETIVQEVVAKRKEHSPELQKILEIGTGWPVGTRAPEFALPTLAGETRSLQSLREEGKTICIVFSSPYCESCRAILPQLNAWMQEHDRSLNMILISRGGTKEHVAKLNDFEASRVLLQPGFEYSEAYGVSATPAALLVDTDGVIQSRLAIGRDEIKQLISSSARQSHKTI